MPGFLPGKKTGKPALKGVPEEFMFFVKCFRLRLKLCGDRVTKTVDRIFKMATEIAPSTLVSGACQSMATSMDEWRCTVLGPGMSSPKHKNPGAVMRQGFFSVNYGGFANQKLVTSLVLTSQAVVFHSCAMLLEPLWVREPMYVTQTLGVLFTPSLESL